MQSRRIKSEGENPHDQRHDRKQLERRLSQGRHDDGTDGSSDSIAEMENLHPGIDLVTIYLDREGLSEYVDAGAAHAVEVEQKREDRDRFGQNA